MKINKKKNKFVVFKLDKSNLLNITHLQKNYKNFMVYFKCKNKQKKLYLVEPRKIKIDLPFHGFQFYIE